MTIPQEWQTLVDRYHGVYKTSVLGFGHIVNFVYKGWNLEVSQKSYLNNDEVHEYETVTVRANCAATEHFGLMIESKKESGKTLFELNFREGKKVTTGTQIDSSYTIRTSDPERAKALCQQETFVTSLDQINRKDLRIEYFSKGDGKGELVLINDHMAMGQSNIDLLIEFVVSTLTLLQSHSIVS